MKTYTVEQVISAECNLEPIECKFCHSLEVTYDQYIRDALCGDCGKWQIEDDELYNKLECPQCHEYDTATQIEDHAVCYDCMQKNMESIND